MEGSWGILALLAVAVRCADCAGGHPRSDQPRMSHSAQSVFKAGFRVSARHFGKVMGMLVATGWPFVATIVAQSIGAMRSVSLNTPWISQAFVILSLLLMLLYGGYFLLSMGAGRTAAAGRGRCAATVGRTPGQERAARR